MQTATLPGTSDDSKGLACRAVLLTHATVGRKKYRLVDFARAASTSAIDSASVVRLEYDPNRSARIALLRHASGKRTC